ncbi:MAG: hypothetical protein Ct9H300mP29_5680 [Candidatus Neomarinimicrobiota bacterium]|nr:MAG: hypothetical protein Ct9H300mP29_5680 [Candidatus Neomarinimicrobiota bacterium]
MRGKPVGKKNMGGKNWADTDPGRCGSLFEHGIVSVQNN